MDIFDEYTPFINEFKKTRSLKRALSVSEHLESVHKAAVEWEIDLENVERWLGSSQYSSHESTALGFMLNAKSVLERVESQLGQTLIGEIRFGPSLMRFDGFARYDLGSHSVWFGVDHPDADHNYLNVLMAHELSHVYRDHQPRVWESLGKPLSQVTRTEYLDAVTPEEHLISEGLATLFSQVVFPQVELHVHHFYSPEEMLWCLNHHDEIAKAIAKELKSDGNVWKFYEEGSVKIGSPSRVQYYWTARTIREWLSQDSKLDPVTRIVNAHSLPAKEFKFLYE
ncbi:MAG: hypothetical protein IT289_00705 [Oligoflexia bacterium]|nr:hypothetical protein [Oligoflexia bacterium]